LDSENCSELLGLGGADAEALFRRELTSAVALETDRQFVAILTEAAPTIGSNGVTAAAIWRRLLAFLERLESQPP
jgi:hypothetical protein